MQVTAAQLVARARELATLPDIYFRVKEVLDDSTSSHEDVAEALGTDPVLAGRLLRLANSAFYGRPGSIATVSRAVGLLGTQQVHDLVLATAVVHAFEDFSSGMIDRRQFWRSSLFSGSAAKLLAEHCDILDCERLFVGGLLAPVGLLILCQEVPVQIRAILRDARERDQDMAALQREQLGFDYAQVSAELFSSWQLPAELVMPIRAHTQPSTAEEGRLEAAIIHIAVQTANAHSQGQSTRELVPCLDDDAWRITALSFESLDKIRQDAQALTEEIVPVLLSAAA
jgi:HD-like signal output (HDOD) protein